MLKRKTFRIFLFLILTTSLLNSCRQGPGTGGKGSIKGLIIELDNKENAD
jgi:hypothetical protein